MGGQAILVVWVMTGVGGWTIGVRNGRGLAGFILGFALGLLGLVIVLLMGKKQPKVVMRTQAGRW